MINIKISYAGPNASLNNLLILLVGDWDTASSFRTVPVRTEVKADKLYSNGTVYNLHHIYDFYNYNYFVDNDATIFEVSILAYVWAGTMLQVCLKPKVTLHFELLNISLLFLI